MGDGRWAAPTTSNAPPYRAINLRHNTKFACCGGYIRLFDCAMVGSGTTLPCQISSNSPQPVSYPNITPPNPIKLRELETDHATEMVAGPSPSWPMAHGPWAMVRGGSRVSIPFINGDWVKTSILFRLTTQDLVTPTSSIHPYPRLLRLPLRLGLRPSLIQPSFRTFQIK